MILLIDNYDSFVYNIYQYLREFHDDILVKRNDEITLDEIIKRSPVKIILSPGPRTPNDAGISRDVIKKFYKEIPILGICLGHQCISDVFGQPVVIADHIRHGKISKINIIKDDPIFQDIPKEIDVVRYHSLVIPKQNSLKELFHILAISSDDHEIMALVHKTYPLYGVQFHPESILTDNGKRIIENFLTI